METYKPTKEMQEEAARAIKWIEEGHEGGTRVGRIRARQIVNGDELSFDIVQRMYSYFSRHEVDKKAEGFEPDEKGYPSKGRVAWGLWGGDAGFVWSTNIVESAKAKQESKGINMANVIHRELQLKKRNYENESEYQHGEKEDGIWSFTISTPDVDRYGTIIVPSGIDYTAYMNNPVVLVNHKSDYLPIGKCLGFFLNGENLEATIQLDMNDEKACKINDKIKNGFVNAVSVGIIPIEQSEQTIDGEKVTTYTKSELVEFSIVTIPANRDALIKKAFENQQHKNYKTLLNKLFEAKRMLTPEQVVAIEEQLLPVIKEAALLFLKEELGIEEQLATQAADEGTMAMAEKVMAILNPDATVEPEPQVEPAPAQPSPDATTPAPAPVEASFETRAGRKIAATTMSLIMEGVGMINEGNKKIKKAIDTERSFSIQLPVKMDAETILNTIEWK
jgi:HK97 family phage prohead protease